MLSLLIIIFSIVITMIISLYFYTSTKFQVVYDDLIKQFDLNTKEFEAMYKEVDALKARVKTTEQEIALAKSRIHKFEKVAGLL